MFKKSFFVVLIQVSGTLLGFLSIYLIAGDMDPEIYSLVGVYNVLAGVMLTFTDLGIETTMMREALYWMEDGQGEKVAEYTTQSLVSRIIALCVTLPILTGYLLFLSQNKYGGNHFVLLMTFLLGAAVSSLNDAMSLVVRAQGGYVFSQLAKTINTYFLKFVGVILYFWRGEQAYLFFYSISSIPLLFVFIIKLKKYFKFRYVRISSTIKKIYAARYLWLKTDLDYLKTNADSFLVSTIFPPAIMGSYTIYKNFEGMAQNFIEGFFDVLAQNMVKYKGDNEMLDKQERRIKVARNIAISLVFIVLFVYSINPKYFVKLVRLEKYMYMQQMVYCIAFVSILYLIGKFEINILALFATSKLNFKIGILMFIVSVVSYMSVWLLPTIFGVLLQRILVYGTASAASIFLFHKYKQELHKNFYH